MPVGRLARTFGNAVGGSAAVELALAGSLLTGALLNVVEVGRYAYTTTQVITATQAGAQIALSRCRPEETPVTLLCPNVSGRVTAALQTTSLGAAVSLQGPIQEAWYCVDASGGLQEIAPASEKPQNCQAAGNPTAVPGLYIRIQAAHDYEPLFPGLTLAEAFDDTIVRDAWMRVR